MVPFLKPGGFSHHYVVDLFFDDLTEDTALEEITEQTGQEQVVVVYARVSANENRPDLDSQAERLCTYCTAKGWKVVKVVKEVGSDWNYTNQKRATTIFPLLSAQSFERENAVTF